MSGLVLVINSASSSIRYQLADLVAGVAVASGLVSRSARPTDVCGTTSTSSDWNKTAPRGGPMAAAQLMTSSDPLPCPPRPYLPPG